MESFFLPLGNWGWLVAGGVLMILELAVPGTFLMWFGLAAAATGLISLAFDLSWQVQTIIFAALSVVAVMGGRDLMRRFGTVEDAGQFLNRRADAMIGRTFTLNEPIVDGVGRVRIDDSVWRVLGPDAPVGTRVTVSKVTGSELIVDRAA